MYANSHAADSQGAGPPKDFGGAPFVVDIAKATLNNDTFRTALWSGSHLQLTVMCIKPGEDIGLEVHPHVDQFLRVEDGCGLVQMGNSRDNLYIAHLVFDDYAIFIPAGAWHNLTNTGDRPLKLYSIYAPPNHLFGTVHQTKEIAEAGERH
ncbi:MAG: cupin domain-containing protein [Defluviitaleaceae bacterium]|nr:cupin domain-containing protein [Defluviitaleaceae bacterium]